jgi:hypothetical protein
MQFPFIRRFLRSAFAARIATAFVTSYIRMVFATSRFEEIGREHADALVAGGRGFIVAFWHQRLLMGAVIRRQTTRRVFMLISTHRDGEIIANAVRPFGIELIRGSAANPKKAEKDKGGAPAIAQMIAALNEAGVVGMTPDGPRGPSRKVQPGIIRLAQLSGAPILPGAYSASPALRLKTWDRFLLALPFCRGVFVGEAPISVSREATPEEIEASRQMLEARLNSCADRADRAVGRSPDAEAIG